MASITTVVQLDKILAVTDIKSKKECVKNYPSGTLTLNVPIPTKVVCFSRLLKCLRSHYGKQCGPIGAVCSGSPLFASILNSSEMLGNYLQQKTSADDIFRCIFSLAH